MHLGDRDSTEKGSGGKKRGGEYGIALKGAVVGRALCTKGAEKRARKVISTTNLTSLDSTFFQLTLCVNLFFSLHISVSLLRREGRGKSQCYGFNLNSINVFQEEVIINASLDLSSPQLPTGELRSASR